MIFACANPDPEITYDEAKKAVPDCIIGTGRSDYPNQINNVSGFPFLFRGALDVGATEINEAMKIAAAYALAGLAKEKHIPEEVKKAYGGQEFKIRYGVYHSKTFGPENFGMGNRCRGKSGYGVRRCRPSH